MSDIAYRSAVRIVRRAGSLSEAWLPTETEPVLFGTHGAIAAHYGVQMSRIHTPPPSTTSWRLPLADYSAPSGVRWRRARSVPATDGSLPKPLAKQMPGRVNGDAG